MHSAPLLRDTERVGIYQKPGPENGVLRVVVGDLRERVVYYVCVLGGELCHMSSHTHPKIAKQKKKKEHGANSLGTEATSFRRIFPTPGGTMGRKSGTCVLGGKRKGGE